MPARKIKSPFRLALVFLLDLALFGAALVVFALFHHVLPRVISENYGSVPLDAAPQDFSFPGKFTENGEVLCGEDFYRDAGIDLQVTTVEENGVVYHLAELYVRNIRTLQTAFAGGSFGKGIADSVLSIAEENGAVFAVSGDYCGIRDRSVVVRNGVIYRKNKAHQIGALYYDGTFRTYPYAVFQIDAAIAGGAWQIWDFGPELLRDGKAITEFDTGISGPNPRMALGYYEPGHYVFVAVDGRQEASRGMTLVELAALFESLGCQSAYNLDGGHSAVMVLNGKIISSPSTPGGREISDIIYLAPYQEDL